MMNWLDLTGFLYIQARMSGFVLFNPILGRRTFPGIFKGGLIMVLSVFLFSTADLGGTVMPSSPLTLMLHILMELLLGFVLSMVVHFFLYIPNMAGFLIDTQMGMTMNQIYDAGSQGNVSVTGQFLNTMMLLLFFAENGHHTLLRIFLTSHELIPFGAVTLGAGVPDAMLALFVECTLLAVKLCMPILGAELVGQLGMGLLMKVIPQINVFSINIELKVIVGVLMLLMLLAPFSEFLLTAEMEMLDSMQSILSITAGG